MNLEVVLRGLNRLILMIIHVRSYMKRGAGRSLSGRYASIYHKVSIVVSLGGANLGSELAQSFLKRALYTLLRFISVIGSK